MAPQHCALVVQRQRPASQVPEMQSALVWQRRPAKSESTLLASSILQARPSVVGAQALFDGVIRSARKFPSTSAMIGFSYQVHEERYWLKSTSPLLPL